MTELTDQIFDQAHGLESSVAESSVVDGIFKSLGFEPAAPVAKSAEPSLNKSVPTARPSLAICTQVRPPASDNAPASDRDQPPTRSSKGSLVEKAVDSALLTAKGHRKSAEALLLAAAAKNELLQRGLLAGQGGQSHSNMISAIQSAIASASQSS